MSCSKKCEKWFCNGESACRGCVRDGTADDIVDNTDVPSVPDVSDDGDDGDDENQTVVEDEYGNTGERMYKVLLKRIEYYYAAVYIAADNREEASDRACEVEDADYEYDESECEVDDIEEEEEE